AWAARKATGTGRGAWLLLGASCVSWAIGQLIWTYYERVRHVPVPFPSLADAGYLAFTPLAIAGILLVSAPSLRAASRLRVSLAALMLFGSPLFITWATALQGTLEGLGSGPTAPPLLQEVLALAYPLGNLVFLACVLLAIPRLPPGTRGSFGLVAWGGFMFA